MNREITSTLWPIAGDVSSQAGSVSVTVVGLNGRPLREFTFVGGETLVYNPNTDTYDFVTKDVMFVNGLPSGDDPYITVNVSPLVKVNGV